MTGKLNGLCARLGQEFPPLISVHCICHRLSWACVKSCDQKAYIKNVSEYLRQLWKYFEDSPKTTAILVRVQLEMANCSVKLPQKKKVCSTRWLSFEAAVDGLFLM